MYKHNAVCFVLLSFSERSSAEEEVNIRVYSNVYTFIHALEVI